MLINFNDCSNFKQHFRNAIIESGITPPAQIIDDGNIHNFSINDESNNTDGWYVLRGGSNPAGEFGCLKAGLEFTRHINLNDLDAIEKPEKANGRPNSTPSNEPASQNKFALNQFSLNGHSEAMKKQMLEDKYILGRLAIYGQYTVFYASPNVGKTLLILWMIIQSIEKGDINGSDIFYINADDDFKGLTYKVELAETYGFHMLSPGHNDFKTAKFLDYIKTMIKEGTAKGKIIFLDTLKKFADVMRKDKCSDFGKIMREFVLSGGSIICLGHVNKHKDPAGKSVFGGTSDITDDADCYYMLEQIQVNDKLKTVRFENHKSRGNVDKTATFTYTIANVQNYQQLLDSVQTLSESEARAIAEINAANNLLTSNQEVIDAITLSINDGVTLKTQLIKTVADLVCTSGNKVKKVLQAHTGKDYSKGHRWICSVMNRNGNSYSLIPNGSGSSYKDQM